MLYRARLAYLLAALAVLPGCIIVVGDGPDDPPADTSQVIVTPACPGSPAFVETAVVVGDRLVVSAAHGGCAPAEMWACWDGTFLESYPVQVPIAIHHAPAGDCDALFTGTISVSLDPVIDAYADAYGAPDTMILRVGDFNPTWQPR